jgi:hypothetical protein
MLAAHDNEDIYYFSPKAVEIAGTVIAYFGGEDCPAPRASEVDHMIGLTPHVGVPFSPEPKEPDDN